jgi:hypothetical protein
MTKKVNGKRQKAEQRLSPSPLVGEGRGEGDWRKAEGRRQKAKPVLVALCCLIAFAGAALAADPLAVPALEKPFSARFAGADSAWNLHFLAGQTRRDLAAADLATWGAFSEPARGIQIVLADGSLLVAENLRIENEHLAGNAPTFGKFNLPLTLVLGIIFRPPHDDAARDKLLDRALDPAGNSDRLLLENGDELSGTITALADNRVTLQTDANPLEVKLDTLRAVLFNPTLVDKPRAGGLRAVAGFRAGDRLTALEMITDGDQTRFKLAGGIKLSAPTASIAALHVLGNRVEYLSDLKPASYRHLPYLALPWPYKTDRSVTGARLRSWGRLYLKGLGMHSPSRITYDLDRPYRRFEADAAIDEQAGQSGSVIFRVFVDDGSGKWQPRAATEIVRGGQPPVPISVDLAGAKRISLLVDFADRGDELDHADWLNARLVRE